MKIAVTTRLLNGRLEGIGHHTFELLNRLIVNHPEIEWHLINDGKKNQILFPQANVIHHKLLPPTRHPLLWYYWYEWAIPRLLQSIQADAVWYPDGMMSLKANTPSLLTIHDLAYQHFPEGTVSSHRRYLEWLMPRQLQKANHLACVSDFTQQDLMNSFDVPEEKLSITYNAANEEFRRLSLESQERFREAYTDGKPYFLYLGSIHPRKNISRLIQAYNLFRKKNPKGPKLVLAGRWAWKSNAIRSTLQGADFQDDIVHLSEIDGIIYTLVGSALAMVYISLWEGFGMPVLEAMQSGVPVITSADSAMSEVARDAAIYIDPLKIDTIAKGLEFIYTKPSLRIKLREEGIKRAQLYNWDDSAITLSKELRSILT
ncbi:MAG: glycosyltransferase involved in cell wall biosynthesis [Saprospiraceae bacterium]|jgi:glycosyltransferase involved in cell wall biosynthesis